MRIFNLGQIGRVEQWRIRWSALQCPFGKIDCLCEAEERERDECVGVVPGEEGSAEGESEDPLQESPQRHPQLGRPSPPLLPRCNLSRVLFSLYLQLPDPSHSVIL